MFVYLILFLFQTIFGSTDTGGDSHTPTGTINLSHCDGSLSAVKVDAHLMTDAHTLSGVPQSFLILFSVSRPTGGATWRVVSVPSGTVLPYEKDWLPDSSTSKLHPQGP